jgi:UDP:flavonoid glycosyltransferase YjiC (YdhE family)
MSYSFLLVSWGTLGNLGPLLTAGRRLRRNEHRVRVMADPVMRDEVEKANFDFITWHRAPTGRDADPVDISDRKDWFQKAIIDPAPAYAADVRDEINRTPTDAVLSIDLLFGAALGAEGTGTPFGMLSPHISIPLLPGLPPAISGLKPPKTTEERAEVAAEADQWVKFWDGFLPSLNKIRVSLGLTGIAHVLDLYARADRFLLAIGQAFDFQADSLPDNLRYVGPLLDEPGWTKPWQAPWPAQSDRPRALIACSTGAQGQGDLVQRVISAMGAVEIDAVTTIGPNLNIADFHAPKNVYLLSSAPHDTVMKDVSLVVTQGGHGTVCRALVNGLPLLVLPNGRDQNANALRVETTGAGLQLPPTASEAEIAAAVKRLLEEPYFGAAARRLGNAIKAEIDASSLVQEMETIAALRRGARPVRQALAQQESLARA